ncbi:hypothetical protein F5B22DRAFT_427568 [Xylaria bambusicola]|uniref:uncharacterized protein n=1 Tax=Xylaria bambusicola TaxID=326684 RepID=UPI0020078D1B|nr:uncharacterized protein F5B22DRAFT_427568 [Xylaria bambusicola]KAI0506903.1 hypothetical protein F5B22DRAFT_427568 [Xylaria bambusicola]
MMAMFDMSTFDNIPMNLDDLGGLTSPQDQPFRHPTPPSTLAPGDSPVGLSVPPPVDAALGGQLQQQLQPAPSGSGSGSGGASGSGSGSALTEFTKRRNWPAKVVEELKDVLYILDANGRIRYTSPSTFSVTGYQSEDLVDTFLRDIVHPDDMGTFTSEMNECIATGNPLRVFYRMKKKDLQYAIFEAVGHAHIAAATFAPNPSNRSPFCQAVFIMSRPYPTRNASLLDSFLEHKIENERLRRRIAELRKEEDEEEAASQQSWLQESRSDVTPSDDTFMSSTQGGVIFKPVTVDTQAMPPPERPLNGALTRENLEGATAGNRPDSIGDKMARYEGSCRTDTIEMFTGLRYLEGERSRGVTTGSSSLTLIKGDVGIAIPVDRDPKTGEKKKKLKIAEEYVCTDCGTLDSPEWRKGPSGPKTLCNACGLRWAKKEKKQRSANGTANTAPPHPLPPGDT